MCLDIFRDAGSAFGKAARRRSMPKTALRLLESAVMAAVAVAVITWKASGLVAIAGFVANVFVLVIGLGIIGGYVIKIVARALGSKGGFFEGLTALAYAFIPISAGILIAALLTLLPLFGAVFGILVLAILFALGLAVLYRGIKELFRVDMITAFVIVSIMAISFIIAIQASLGLNLLTRVVGI